MGANAFRPKTTEQLGAALQAARRAQKTTVIVCPTDPDRPLLSSGAFWDLGVTEAAESQETKQLAEAHLKARARQRSY
jgi:TPP-dependent trihydroxycyclohexane-1,2-dione (THcHDO) dehydratase